MEKKNRMQLVMGIAAVFLCGIAYLVLGPSGASLKADSASGTEFVAGHERAETVKDSASVSAGAVYVYICGAVKKPGVYKFDHDPRLVEALDEAGGFTKKADKTSVNLASRLSDGDQVVIGEKGDHGAEISGMKSDSGSDSSGLIDINTAGVEELKQIPGIGDSKANAIVSYRSEHGRFKNIEDLMQITGIKQGIFDKIKDHIRV